MIVKSSLDWLLLLQNVSPKRRMPRTSPHLVVTAHGGRNIANTLLDRHSNCGSLHPPLLESAAKQISGSEQQWWSCDPEHDGSSPTKIRRRQRVRGVVTCAERLIKSLRVNGHGQHLSTLAAVVAVVVAPSWEHRTSLGKWLWVRNMGFTTIKASSDT